MNKTNVGQKETLSYILKMVCCFLFLGTRKCSQFRIVIWYYFHLKICECIHRKWFLMNLFSQIFEFLQRSNWSDRIMIVELKDILYFSRLVGWLVGSVFFPFSSLFLLLFAFFYSNSIALASMVSICGKNESIIRISHVGGMKSIQCMKRVHWWILKLMPYTYTRTYSYIYVKICRNKRAPFTYRGFVPHS